MQYFSRFLLLMFFLFFAQGFFLSQNVCAQALIVAEGRDNIVRTPPRNDGSSIYIGKDAEGNSVMRAKPAPQEEEDNQTEIPYVVPEVIVPPYNSSKPRPVIRPQQSR